MILMNRDKIKELDSEYIVHTYGRSDLVAESGSGAHITDMDGSELIDLTSGIGVCSLGYCNEEWVSAVKEQLDKLQHISNLYYTQPAPQLAEKLCKRSGMKKAFFGNSGAEANECAIKSARKYGSSKSETKTDVVSLIDSFHGRTLQTLTATGQDDMHKYFGPFPDGFKYVKANDAEAMEAAVDENTCAVIMEIVQGEGGVNVLDADYVKAVREICDKNDALLIIDEVQTGIGRTGKFFAFEHCGIEPDMVTFAKGIGGGLPLGGVLFNEKTMDILQPGDHGTTFGANPVICAGALSVLDQMTDELLDEAAAKGEYIMTKLAGFENVTDVSGLGMMIGFKVSGKKPGDFVGELLGKGIIALTAHDKVRLLPPLVITYEDIDKALAVIEETAKNA